ncbi:hypothetical protein AQUCO_01800159v1 [Aquilegia coerulea]|uniref:Uncharacterized protein n=1 Tax=Aquilegia coerulea TaxID=218851 RepID=A0A2G5DK92_AQUCA|nr:hypothetical protein AQUCO_01800159v1 [Aquilegia coerulea]
MARRHPSSHFLTCPCYQKVLTAFFCFSPHSPPLPMSNHSLPLNSFIPHSMRLHSADLTVLHLPECCKHSCYCPHLLALLSFSWNLPYLSPSTESSYPCPLPCFLIIPTSFI